ncbi:hypothetical protein [Pontibacter arcticus]|uniref:Uncharacterized protein n=1 Tax=Pontibacter arcticus TaxID=2080288 RepID=A0A364RHR2_9BACT|nr:hypothetical protein [Pontibacter arcticus]RAU83823.1 hypothetical protein DP923_01795 [Pontibacter arcticus]
MEDRLKKFVSENREEFDVFEPRPELWQQICQQIPPPQKETTKVIKFNFGGHGSLTADMMLMRVAAAILLLLGCGLTLYLAKLNVPETANNLATVQPATIRNIAPELADAEVYYINQIEEKEKRLSAYDLKVLGLDGTNEIDRELARLDSSYNQLKKQLLSTPNTERVVEAMIQNLRIRTQVLNHQLEILQNINKETLQPTSETQTNEKTNV